MLHFIFDIQIRDVLPPETLAVVSPQVTVLVIAVMNWLGAWEVFVWPRKSWEPDDSEFDCVVICFKWVGWNHQPKRSPYQLMLRCWTCWVFCDKLAVFLDQGRLGSLKVHKHEWPGRGFGHPLQGVDGSLRYRTFLVGSWGLSVSLWFLSHWNFTNNSKEVPTVLRLFQVTGTPG